MGDTIKEKLNELSNERAEFSARRQELSRQIEEETIDIGTAKVEIQELRVWLEKLKKNLAQLQQEIAARGKAILEAPKQELKQGGQDGPVATTLTEKHDDTKSETKISPAVAHLQGALGTLEIPGQYPFACVLMDPETQNLFGLDTISTQSLGGQVELVKNYRTAMLEAFKTGHEKIPKLPRITISGCGLECSKPIITLLSPSCQQVSGGIIPPDIAFLQSGKGISGGVFGFYVSVKATLIDGGGDPKPFNVRVIQNCTSHRQVTYDDGSVISRSFKWCQDVIGDTQVLQPGGQAVVCLTDAPKWQWPDGKDIVLTKVEVLDAFRVFVLVTTPEGEDRCLVRFEWDFKSDGKAASYNAGKFYTLDGSTAADAITTGGSANDNTDGYRKGKAKPVVVSQPVADPEPSEQRGEAPVGAVWKIIRRQSAEVCAAQNGAPEDTWRIDPGAMVTLLDKPGEPNDMVWIKCTLNQLASKEYRFFEDDQPIIKQGFFCTRVKMSDLENTG